MKHKIGWKPLAIASYSLIQTARLYAVKTVPLAGAEVYMFLSRLPAGMADEKFFPANGTAVLFNVTAKGPRVLKACGTDCNTGACQGWIFDAIET